MSHPFAIVSVDLWAVPGGLTQRVLELVNNEGEPLPPDRFVLAATHTHHSPGNFMTSRIHADLASFEGGYDPHLFDWLARRIADAVKEAARNAKTARLTLYEGVACDLQVNRSLQPFAENGTAALDIMNARNDACKETLPARFSAVNPAMRVLQIEHVGSPSRIVGLLTFFAVHPTVLPSRSPLYSGDLTDAAMILLERAYARAKTPIVSAFFNGAEGDVIAPKTDRDLDEVVKLAEKLASHIQRISGTQPRASLEDPRILSSLELVSKDADGFAPRPIAGPATVGGGELDRSQYYSEGWWDGVVVGKEVLKGHGPKAPPFDKRTPLPLIGDLGIVRKAVKWAILPESHFPKELPVSLHQIPGMIELAALPVEMTTAMGWSATAEIQKHAGATPVQLIGLANEYYSYVTTEKEYALQHYEGASTLLGPAEGRVLIDHLQALTPKEQSTELAHDKTKFISGQTKTFGPAHIAVRRSGPLQTNTIPDAELENVIPERLHFKESLIPRFEWTEECIGDWCPADWAPDQRNIQIIRSDGVEENESNLRIVAVIRRGLIQEKDTQRHWVAFWIPPEHLDPSTEFWFRVKPADSSTDTCSTPATLANLPMVNGILAQSLTMRTCP
jgi:neutral ceramidase